MGQFAVIKRQFALGGGKPKIHVNRPAGRAVGGNGNDGTGQWQ